MFEIFKAICSLPASYEEICSLISLTVSFLFTSEALRVAIETESASTSFLSSIISSFVSVIFDYQNLLELQKGFF